ncbi:hypothetical protein PACTADRAFT_48115 [Pachysolen tannophilus NRRL Y-2460]|uniref:Xylulose kinase n=1 Tax=Pachysolen tannophilus NRRL Y-2460 TaxID=669874 RepID=A0A1E4U2V3_PACTA|nr:hypothetical protein PACTADRAFT_48115 [Pachysolen tannophilus NRRL Y-2460]
MTANNNNNTIDNENDDLFLGFDLSTQTLKIVATHANLKHFKLYRVEFDKELGHYGIKDGVLTVEEKGEIFAPVEMWIEALDLIFDKMLKDEFPFNRVKGISGSCQQHGSVYWSSKAESLLGGLSSSKTLKEQLCPEALTFPNSPNWQDHSTGPELEIFEKAVGGAENLSKITGSRAHYRFTGTQIRKLSTRINRELYHKTFKISLVSSFLASVLCGKLCEIDEADGCGMNLYDIEKREWSDELLAVAAGVHPKVDKVDSKTQYEEGIEELKSKLGTPTPIGASDIGCISNYYVSKFGFNKNCKIYPFTGDNLATILSLPLAVSDILVSLGTSTTVLLVTDQYVPSPSYHIFKHPTVSGSYMGMICYCNGALPRGTIKDEINKKYNIKDSHDWSKFNEILEKSDPLQGEMKLGVYFTKGEIVPNCLPQTRRYEFDSEKNKLVELDSWNIEKDVSAIVESQALSCRLRAGPMLASTTGSSKQEQDAGNFSKTEKKTVDKFGKFGKISSDGIEQSMHSLLSHPSKVFYVGGASKNIAIVRKFSSILGALHGNYRIDLTDACALGGCYRSIWSYEYQQDPEKTGNYHVWLNNRLNWEEEVEKLETQDEWEEYVDGVGILSKIEETLRR